MKKFITLSLCLFITGFCFAIDFDLRLMPAFKIPLNSAYSSNYGITASADFVPFKIRETDSLSFSVQGGVEFLNEPHIVTQYVYCLDFAAGYTFRPIDRFSLTGEVFFGGFTYPDPDTKKLKIANGHNNDDDEDDEKKDGISGFETGLRILANYHVLPALTVSAFTGFKSFLYNPHFMDNIEFGLSFKYNFNRGLSPKPKIELDDYVLNPVFPIFYSRYDDHEFGSAFFVNCEDNDITDVEMSIFVEKFMSSPNVFTKHQRVKRSDSFYGDITAFFNESILQSETAQDSDAIVAVSYKSLGKLMKYQTVLPLSVLSRNSMSWCDNGNEDNARAAAFVSSRDASALKFARNVVSSVKNSLDAKIPENIQFAAALFGALKKYGINYVKDPASSFEDNIGTDSVDFLQFPYQTLMYHGGDCDDLSILHCSLLESIGVPAAFITVPGHIFIAFDAGINAEEAKKVLVKGKYIEAEDGTVWIPVEITLTQDSFRLAWNYGVREWDENPGTSELLPVQNAWTEYLPVSVPEADKKIIVPPRSEIIDEFQTNIKLIKEKLLR